MTNLKCSMWRKRSMTVHGCHPQARECGVGGEYATPLRHDTKDLPIEIQNTFRKCASRVEEAAVGQTLNSKP